MGRDISSDAEIERIIFVNGTGTSTPPSGYGYIYEKSGLFYFKNHNGVEYNLTSLHFLNDHTDVNTGGVAQNYLLIYDEQDGWGVSNDVNLRDAIIKGNLTVSGTAQFGSTGELIDWSNSGTVVGWGTFNWKLLRYKRIGNSVFVNFDIEGTSNNTATTFTLPYTSKNISFGAFQIIYTTDNGTPDSGVALLPNISAIVTFYPTVAGGLWTASGTKRIAGQFWYETE